MNKEVNWHKKNPSGVLVKKRCEDMLKSFEENLEECMEHSPDYRGLRVSWGIYILRDILSRRHEY